MTNSTAHAKHSVRLTPMQQAINKAMQRRSAKLGMWWIKILVLVAVFSPLMANTVPLLSMGEGGVQLPFMKYINAEDVVFFVAFIAALILRRVNASVPIRGLIWLSIIGVTMVLASALVKPPRLIDYEAFKQIETGQFVLHAPVPYSPSDYLREHGDNSLEAPLEAEGRKHWMGTDVNGADVASRMIHASRIALTIGFIATGIAMVLGVIIGGLMGYYAGRVDMLGMRLVEIFEAIPVLFLLLTFVAFFGSSLYVMMVIIGVTSWSGFARYLRAEFLKLRHLEYVQAAVALGLPLRSILFKHMLPNGVAPLLVVASFSVASAILAEATLSFLGLGLVNEPSWGALLNQAVQSSTFNWWLALFPGGAIFLTVFAYNLIGEALRDAIDPNADH